MAVTDSKVYCSAGIDYIVLCPNGDVYRCMADYGENHKVLFNVKDGWHRLEKPLLCSHPRCDASCDTRYTKKAIFDPESDDPRIVGYNDDLQEEMLQEHASYLRCPSEPVDESFRRHIHVVWLPTFRCNYTCQYCEYAAGRHKIHEIRSAYPELSVSEWVDVWQAIHEMYDSIGVSISGGEPMLSGATLPVINLLEDVRGCDITTNLSVNPMAIMRHMAKPSLVTASLHPTSARFNREIFLGTLLCLKNNGYNVSVNFVGYPLQLFMAREYKEWCDAHDIPFNIDQWCGADHNGFYSRLSEAEQHFLDEMSRGRRIQFRRFDHEIETDPEQIDIEQGSPFTIKGSVKNTGTVPWHNRETEGSNLFKLGLRIMRFGNERDALLEKRIPLPCRILSPGETCDFEIDIPNCTLSPEIYLVKIDVVKEGPEGFWFEHRGADCTRLKLGILRVPRRYIMVLDAMDVEIQNGGLLELRGKVKNTGLHPWLCNGVPEEEAYKIGVSVSREENPAEVLFDFRALTIQKDIYPGDWYDFEIKKSTRGLKAGTYCLKIDILKEGFWWFEQRGAQPVKINITLEDSSKTVKAFFQNLLRRVRGN